MKGFLVAFGSTTVNLQWFEDNGKVFGKMVHSFVDEDGSFKEHVYKISTEKIPTGWTSGWDANDVRSLIWSKHFCSPVPVSNAKTVEELCSDTTLSTLAKVVKMLSK